MKAVGWREGKASAKSQVLVVGATSRKPLFGMYSQDARPLEGQAKIRANPDLPTSVDIDPSMLAFTQSPK